MSDATASGAFFAMPFELREQIYVAAFGGRTIHICHQKLPPTPGRSWYADYRGIRKRKPSPTWAWWGSVCYRHPGLLACWDTCQDSFYPASCAFNPEDMPGELVIGIMGWLLTCRQALVRLFFVSIQLESESPKQIRRQQEGTPHVCQSMAFKKEKRLGLLYILEILVHRSNVVPKTDAIVCSYIEAIDILYRTNTIHIGDVALTRQLSQVLLPQKVATITALEFRWNLDMQKPSSGQDTEGWSAFDALIGTVATNFAKLKTLYISIQTNSYNYIADHMSADVEASEENLFGPVDQMVKQRGSTLQCCRIATPHSFHLGLLIQAKRAGARLDKQPNDFWRFWRPVTKQQHAPPGNNHGYWLESGVIDTPARGEQKKWDTTSPTIFAIRRNAASKALIKKSSLVKS